MIKLCVPITGADREEIRSQLQELALLDFEMIEWRADYYFSMEALEEIRKAFPDKELLFTFRTKAEGGECQPTNDFLLHTLITVGFSGLVELIDLELEGMCKTNPGIVETLRASGVKLMISNHDFEKTPSKEEIIDRFKRMEAIGGDMGKIAVMPKDSGDVEILILAAEEASRQLKIPIVAVSMGELGEKTRINGEDFGSILTFGSLGKASAPGQIPAKELKEKLVARNKAKNQSNKQG